MKGVKFYKIDGFLPEFNKDIHEGIFVLDGDNNFWLGTDSSWQQISYQEKVDDIINKVEDDYYSLYYHKKYDFENYGNYDDLSYSNGSYDNELNKLKVYGTVEIPVTHEGTYRVLLSIGYKTESNGIISTDTESYSINDIVPSNCIVYFTNVSKIKFSINIPVWLDYIIVQEEPSPVTKVSQLENDRGYSILSVEGETLVSNI